MASTHSKLAILAFGITWCLILMFLLSNFDFPSKGKRGYGANEPTFDSPTKINLGQSSRLINEFMNVHNEKGEHKQIIAAKQEFRHSPNQKQSRNPISVVIAGNEQTIVGIVTVINSVHLNTNATVCFYVVLPEQLISHFKIWMDTSLPSIKYVVKSLPALIPKHNYQFAKLFIIDLFPYLEGKIIYLSPDTIVQGDITELQNLHYKEGQLIFASNECESISKHRAKSRPFYSFHLNFTHPLIKNLHLNPKTCIFNSDVFVGNISEWRLRNIQKEFKQWFKFSKHSGPLHGFDKDSNEAESIMLLVFYQRVGYLDKLWHVGHLGSEATSSTLPHGLVKQAKLLHWNGHFKPWLRKAAFSKQWDKYYVKDPTGGYSPLRRKI